MLDIHAAALQGVIAHSVFVTNYDLNVVQLSPHTGYVEGEVIFVDRSRLAFFEFLRRKTNHWEREKYRYQYMDGENGLLFRYDNAPHHQEIATFPHHKHLSIGVVDSNVPVFSEVVAEIESHILTVWQ